MTAECGLTWIKVIFIHTSIFTFFFLLCFTAVALSMFTVLSYLSCITMSVRSCWAVVGDHFKTVPVSCLAANLPKPKFYRKRRKKYSEETVQCCRTEILLLETRTCGYVRAECGLTWTKVSLIHTWISSFCLSNSYRCCCQYVYGSESPNLCNHGMPKK